MQAAISAANDSPVLPFLFEERLQELIALNPQLLDCQGSPGPRLLLGREITLDGEAAEPSGPVPEAGTRDAHGRIDVCFAEQDGSPCIVEAKLSDNPTINDVVDQAIGYAKRATADPKGTADKMRGSLGRIARRFPGQPSVFRTVRDYRADWDPDKLHAALEEALRNGRCRVVIAADSLPVAVVREAQRLRSSLDGIRLDLVNVRRHLSGQAGACPVEETPEEYDRRYRPPMVGQRPTWELVPRHQVRAVDFMKEMIKDRFYDNSSYPENRFDYRVKRIRFLPAVLHYEASPGRAPLGDLHQIERSRREGCAPVMPNIRLLEKSGNPYPRDGNDRSVITDGVYRDITRICYATWESLKARGSLELAVDKERAMQQEIVRSARYDLNRVSPAVRIVALGAPFDALRDCALLGLVRHYRRYHAEHRFELGERPKELVAFR